MWTEHFLFNIDHINETVIFLQDFNHLADGEKRQEVLRIVVSISFVKPIIMFDMEFLLRLKSYTMSCVLGFHHSRRHPFCSSVSSFRYLTVIRCFKTDPLLP